MKNKKEKINKDSIPEGFTVLLALVDFLPVLFFVMAFGLVGNYLKSPLIMIGTILCFLSGLIKVMWKIIVAEKRKNIWWMFVQMRYAMPLGFLVMLIGFIICCVKDDLSSFFPLFVNTLSIVFLALAVVGITCMIVFSMTLDAKDKKANWIEQICNSIAQLCFFLAFLFALVL